MEELPGFSRQIPQNTNQGKIQAAFNTAKEIQRASSFEKTNNRRN
jgi:hypothetical protein